MQIKIESRHLGEVVVIVPEVFQDSRGFSYWNWSARQCWGVLSHGQEIGFPFVSGHSSP